MSTLYFKVASDWEEVVRLRAECERLESQLKKMNSRNAPTAVAELETQLGTARQKMIGLVTEAAKTGTVMENDFKKGVYDASQSVNDLTQKIISQKAVVKDVEADVKRLGEAYRAALKGDPLSASGKLNEYNAARKALDEEKASLFGLQQEQSRARLSVKRLRDEYALYNNEGENVQQTNNGMSLSFGKVLGVIGGIGVLKELASEITTVTGQFQRFENVLTNALGGDNGKAKAYLGDISDFAAKTNFQLDELTDNFLKFVNRGVTPTMDSMTKLGDFTNSVSKPYAQLSEAILDINNPERWKEFGVQVQTNGSKVDLTFRGMTIEADKTVESVMDAIERFGSMDGIKGSTEAIAGTIEGQMSNLQDTITSSLNEIGQSNADLISGSISATSTLVENYDKVGRAIVGLVGVYGAYRTAVVITNFVLKEQAAINVMVAASNGVFSKSLAYQRVWTERAQKAQSLLNKTMLNNPFVLLGTLIGALVAKMILFNNEQEKTLSKTELLKKITDSYASELAKEKSELSLLMSVAKNEKVSKENRLDAIKKLNDISPTYLGNLNLENINTKLATDAVEQYTLSLEKNAKAKAIVAQMQEIEEAKLKNAERLSQQKEKYEDQDWFSKGWDWLNEAAYNMPVGVTGGAKPHIIADREESKAIQENNKELEKKYQLLIDINSENERGSKTNVTIPLNIQLEAERKNLEYLQEEHAKLVEQMKNKPIGFMVDALDQQKLDNYISRIKDSEDKIKELSKPDQSQIQNKSYWEQKKKDAETAQAALATSEKNSEKWNKYTREIQQAQEEIAKYDTTGKSDKSANTLKSEQSDRLKAIEDLRKSISEAEVQSELDIRQRKIDTMREGSEKELAQMALNHDKQKDAIRRQADDMIKERQELERKQWEYDNPKWKEKGMTFKPTTTKVEQLPESQQKQLLAYDEIARQANKKAEEDYQRSLLERYQDYTDKRLAIEKKYNDDIAALQEERKKAVASGDTEKVDRIDRSTAQATKDKGQELMGHDYEQLKQTPEYVRAFENLNRTSSETLKSLLSQLENAKRTAAQVLSPDQLREYTSTIQEIMSELDSRNPFQSLSDKKEELAQAERDLADAQAALETAKRQAEEVKGGAKIQTGVKITGFDKKTKQVTSEKTYLSEAKALEKVGKATDKYNQAKDDVTDKNAKVKDSEKEVRAQIDKLAKSVSEVGDAIGGPAGEIISLIGEIGSFTMMAMDGVKAAADTSAQAISTVEKASVILAIISAAVQIATKMFDLFGADTTTEKYEEAKEAYESYINILDKVIEKQLELAETLTGDNANAAYDKAIELTKQKSENAKVLGRQYLNSGASWKSHSKGYEEVDDMSWEGWNQAAQALGMGIDQFKNKMGGRMTGLFDLTDEQLVKLQTDAGIFWSQLDSDTQKYADQIVNGVAEVADIMEQKMSDVTLIDLDGLRSDFQDLLTDMDSDSADFADNFEEYMRNAIINSMLKEKYMDRLKEWREKFYKSMKEGTIEQDYQDLKDEGTQISNDMRAEREKMADMFGWTSDESSSQDSTKKGFETMSQDTGNELNGRFTALNVTGEEIKGQNILQSQSLNLITMRLDYVLMVNSEMRNTMADTRDIIANSYLELVQISENTGAIVKPIQQIQKDMAEVKKNTSKL